MSFHVKVRSAIILALIMVLSMILPTFATAQPPTSEIGSTGQTTLEASPSSGDTISLLGEGSVLVRVVAADRDPVTTVVREVMTRDPVFVTPEMPVRDAMVLVTEKRFRHLPVVRDGRLCGIVSSGDLTRWVVRDQRDEIDHLNAYITDTQTPVASGFQFS